MRRKKPIKAPFVVTVSAAAAAVSLIVGCNGLVTGAGDDGALVTNPPGPAPTEPTEPLPEPPTNPPAPQQPCPEVEP